MMKEILKRHLKQYPRMQIVDVVKLLFQSEFGGGHMVASPSKSLAWIRAEWKDAASDADCLEEIGDGMYRMYLSVLNQGLRPETLNQMFVRTADRTIGKRERFEQKLGLLVEGCEQGDFPFPP